MSLVFIIHQWRWMALKVQTFANDVRGSTGKAFLAFSATSILFQFKTLTLRLKSCQFFGFFVLLALTFWIFFHITILAKISGVLWLVRAADGSLFTAKFEVTVYAHALSVVLLVCVWALSDHTFFSNCGLITLLLFSPSPRALFTD